MHPVRLLYPKQVLHPYVERQMFNGIVERVEHSCELSTANIKLQGFSLDQLLPIIQEYADQTGKFFSGYYDYFTDTFHVANCPYTGVGASLDELDKSKFDQKDLDYLTSKVREQTGRNIEAVMVDPLLPCKPYESRIVIGLQEGTHGQGALHHLEDVTRALSDVAGDIKQVEVVVIRPNQKPYKEPAACVNVWDEDRDAALLKELAVLNLARQWNHHVILEELYRFTSYALKLRIGKLLEFRVSRPEAMSPDQIRAIHQANT